MYAYGISNIFGSFFGCFPSAASLSRSSLLENVGGKTLVINLKTWKINFIILYNMINRLSLVHCLAQ